MGKSAVLYVDRIRFKLLRGGFIRFCVFVLLSYYFCYFVCKLLFSLTKIYCINLVHTNSRVNTL
jgi:hypothetical protein